MTEQRLAELDWDDLTTGPFFPSPAAWEDQVLYFLMLDRFSDGNETRLPRQRRRSSHHRHDAGLSAPADAGNADRQRGGGAQWRDAGGGWVGGTLRGSRASSATSGGSASRPSGSARSSSRSPSRTPTTATASRTSSTSTRTSARARICRTWSRTAHANGIRVILDIILNHAGNVFAYDPDRYSTEPGTGQRVLDPRWDGDGYASRASTMPAARRPFPFGRLDRPIARQPGPTARSGRRSCRNRRRSPAGPHQQLGLRSRVPRGRLLRPQGHHSRARAASTATQPSPALLALCEVYKFWIAYADLDGFRVDTVKHMDPGAARFFASVIHEFAQTPRQGELLPDRRDHRRARARLQTLEETGLDAALGIDDDPGQARVPGQGLRDPADYFDLFRNSLLVRKDSHVWFRNKVVTVFDDHDQVRKGDRQGAVLRRRPGAGPARRSRALALNATTLGIPCIYYGSEQRFDGAGGNDRYIREAMFGGEFGAVPVARPALLRRGRRSTGSSPRSSRCAASRLALRRGRQYLREISGDGVELRPAAGDRRADPLGRAVVAALQRPRDAARDQHRPRPGDGRPG